MLGKVRLTVTSFFTCPVRDSVAGGGDVAVFVAIELAPKGAVRHKRKVNL